MLISLIVFFMIDQAPGGPMAAFEENPNITAEDMARLSELMGADQPVHVKYWNWIRRVAVGDWGYSQVTYQPVMEMILERLPATLQLMTVRSW